MGGSLVQVEEEEEEGGTRGRLLLQEMKDAKALLHSELWHACAGPLVSLPQIGSLVYYFPQGHIHQLAVSTKRPISSQIPNYPSLPSQLMCQLHNLILHADKNSDEIFAQMSLQPIKTEKDVFPVHNFGHNAASKHPTEFFCKTLTASDTSTHGGFSVPRRAAEKLFPPLDYTMQPPFQELVVKDLHHHTWTFRHIYRGQPKRHLLTTGWSVFVGSKRLQAGDAVLFIRDEKGQLMIGVRRANRQQTSLPSSVLSADSMHIGVLAAAAHAAANRTPFTVFYNPRACPTEFVIPATKYRKAIYGTQISAGMRFGMMFETEESAKRRYMGTVVGVSDLDPLRWPGSKWRNLQVEWDEPGCGDKQNRVSAWEIETPESLFLFPSLTSGFKRTLHPSFFGGEPDWGSMMKRPFFQLPDTALGNSPCTSVLNIWSEPLAKAAVMRPENRGYPAMLVPFSTGPTLEEAKLKLQSAMFPNSELLASQSSSVQNCQQRGVDQPSQGSSLGQEHIRVISSQPAINADSTKPEPLAESERSELTASAPACEEKGTSSVSDKPVTQHSAISDNQKFISLPAESLPSQLPDVPSLDASGLNGLFPYMDSPDWPLFPGSFPMPGKLSPSLPESIDPSLPTIGQDIWEQSQNLNSVKYSTQSDRFGSYSQLSDETNNQSGIYSCVDLDVANGGNAVVGTSPSNAVLNNMCSSKEMSMQYSDCLMGNFSSSQDLQSQITSVSLADSQAFLQDFPDSSAGGGTSSSNVDFDGSSLLQTNSWSQVVPPMRTYTKVQKTGSVGRSIDVMSFKDYTELGFAIERMFGLEGLLNDPRGSEWKLVYVDFENDVLLVGDDPWEEFVSCVRCIRILSPAEVQQMSKEGMQLLNSTA